MHPRAAQLVLWAAASLAHAQAPASAPAGDGSRDVAPFPDSCLKQVVKLLHDKGAIHDGVHKEGLRTVPPATAREVLLNGLHRGQLAIDSFVRPPSVYEVYQFPGGAGSKKPELCPLEETYLAFTAGGFRRQPTTVYGPLR